ncbi:MAG: signal peptidase II [Candidatus Omnitrophica bacterium]|nr:signal peptidase II [Candidatus Omnitrophota bacterium]
MIFIIVFCVLSLDCLTKFIAQRNLSLNDSIPVVKNIFHLTLVHNRGAAFGILKNQLPLFIVTSLFAVILIAFSLKEKKGSLLYCTALSLILAGALGNLIDRLTLGYVVDFLDFRIWPVFNVADSAITIGAVLLALSILKTKKVS